MTVTTGSERLFQEFASTFAGEVFSLHTSQPAICKVIDNLKYKVFGDALLSLDTVVAGVFFVVNNFFDVLYLCPLRAFSQWMKTILKKWTVIKMAFALSGFKISQSCVLCMRSICITFLCLEFLFCM